MTDLISRADARNAVQDHFNDDGFKGYFDGQKMMDRINALPSAETTGALDDAIAKYVADGLMELPSAEAEWIPCSEKLPSESGTYLTTTAKGSVCTDHYYANSTDLSDRHWSYRSRREPIAWMPLPKPYREDGEV